MRFSLRRGGSLAECLVAAALLGVVSLTLPSLFLGTNRLLERQVLRMRALEVQARAAHAVQAGACNPLALPAHPVAPRLWHERHVMTFPGGVAAHLTTGWSGASPWAEPHARLRWIVEGWCE